MENSTGSLRIEKHGLGNYTNSFKSSVARVERKNDKIKSRLGFVYFIALVLSLIVLFLR